MSRVQQVLWALLVVIVLGGAFVWWSSSQIAPPASPANSAPSADSGALNTNALGASGPVSTTVTFNGTSFSPQTVTIPLGGTVAFVSTAGNMWVASDPQPSHIGYDGTTMLTHCPRSYTGPKPFDECGSGTSWSFTFNKAGSWGYHDHLDPSIGGTVVVEAQ